MRPTWIVLGVVVGLGAVAYLKLRSKADAASPSLSSTTAGGATGAKASEGVTPPSTPGMEAAGPGGAAAGAASTPLAAPALPGEPASGPEAQARALVLAIAERTAANDAAGLAPLVDRLEREFGDTDEARRHGLAQGLEDSRVALDDKKSLDARTEAGTRARRSLSRALFLPELFDAATGHPTEARTKLLASIASVQSFVMTRVDGVKDVTKPYVVAAGDNPLRIVSRDKLAFGPHALLFWNQGGSLDPKRLKVGDRLLVPVETLSIHVSLARHLLGIYLGDALVKEFSVGVGKAATPTYPGTYEVKDKYLNPDWHSPTGVIPYGDARNELGDAWIPISSPEKPKGYGIHGTIKPDTVGTDCSNGCVRLHNEEAVEMTGWVRTSKGDGQATKVFIR